MNQEDKTHDIFELIKYFPFAGYPYWPKVYGYAFTHHTGVTNWAVDQETKKQTWSSITYTFLLNAKHYSITDDYIRFKSREVIIGVDGRTVFKAKVPYVDPQEPKSEKVEVFTEDPWIDDLKRLICKVKQNIEEMKSWGVK